jgi:hypothetical protein
MARSKTLHQNVGIKEFRAAYGNFAAELITTYAYESGDSGGGLFYDEHLISVCKAAQLINKDRTGGCNSTNEQLINFLFPEGEKREKTDCFIFGGRSYCVPAPIYYTRPPANAINPKPQTFPKENQTQVPKQQPIENCQPFKDEIVRLKNQLATVSDDFDSLKIQYTGEKGSLTKDKNRLYEENQELLRELARANAWLVYFTLEGEENCRETDVEAARIREMGKNARNIVTVILKRQDVAVNSVPRLFIMPDRRTIYGEKDVLAYLKSIN